MRDLQRCQAAGPSSSGRGCVCVQRGWARLFCLLPIIPYQPREVWPCPYPPLPGLPPLQGPPSKPVGGPSHHTCLTSPCSARLYPTRGAVVSCSDAATSHPRRGCRACVRSSTSLSRSAVQRRVRRRRLMHPTAPSALDSLSPHMLQPLRSALTERWAVARERCDEAAAACARAAEVRHASV